MVGVEGPAHRPAQGAQDHSGWGFSTSRDRHGFTPPNQPTEPLRRNSTHTNEATKNYNAVSSDDNDVSVCQRAVTEIKTGKAYPSHQEADQEHLGPRRSVELSEHSESDLGPRRPWLTHKKTPPPREACRLELPSWGLCPFFYLLLLNPVCGTVRVDNARSRLQRLVGLSHLNGLCGPALRFVLGA